MVQSKYLEQAQDNFSPVFNSKRFYSTLFYFPTIRLWCTEKHRADYEWWT